MLKTLAAALFMILIIIGCASQPTTQQPKKEQTNMNSGAQIKSGPIVYVALGDSTGVGQGAHNGGYVARMFKKLVAQRPGSNLTNLCVSGSTTIDVIREQLDDGI